MNYYPYTGNPSTDKMGMPGMYGTSMPTMAAYQQQAGLQPGPSPAGLQPAQHYGTLGSSPSYPATSIYASSIGSNPYGSVSGVPPGAAGNPYAAAQSQQRPTASPTAHPGYTGNPYAAMQGTSPAAYSNMVPATTAYPGSSYSVGSSGMFSYPAAATHTQMRSPGVAAYQAVGGYPAGLPNPNMPTYAATGASYPGLVRAAPVYPGTSPYSRLP